MNKTPIKAVTFDFWRTLFYSGINAKERRIARAQFLADTLTIPLDQAKEAMKHQERSFLRIHVEEQRTLLPLDAIPFIESALDCAIPTETAQVLADHFSQIILSHPPDPVDGALDAVKAAAQLVPVGVISDTGISPGAPLTRLLEKHGFMDHLTSLTFSDDIGVAKPQAAMYYHAAKGLGVDHTELLHIGDLEPTDITGALNIGARAALFGGDNDKFVGNTRAHYTFTHWNDFVDALPQILKDESSQ
ncbi:MAG: hypothetical protein COA73_15585 [Candidatus Hydrogenedentota bacterium]|nr:MAG: hypothetical protein COA73_15585 [Candidatus Hydrogenedentota bacterium]